jgi:hypothetical protein
MKQINDYIFSYYGEANKCTNYIYSSEHRRGTDNNRRDLANAVYLATGKSINTREYYHLNNTYTLKKCSDDFLKDLTTEQGRNVQTVVFVDCREWQ